MVLGPFGDDHGVFRGRWISALEHESPYLPLRTVIVDAACRSMYHLWSRAPLLFHPPSNKESARGHSSHHAYLAEVLIRFTNCRVPPYVQFRTASSALVCAVTCVLLVSEKKRSRPDDRASKLQRKRHKQPHKR